LRGFIEVLAVISELTERQNAPTRHQRAEKTHARPLPALLQKSSQSTVTYIIPKTTMCVYTDDSIKNYLPPDFMPSAQDVVCARGKEAYMHPGNKRYREIIARNLLYYTGAESKKQKSIIVMRIIEEVRTDAPAGFIRYCSLEHLWYEIGDDSCSKLCLSHFQQQDMHEK
jgi:hypothetical protein